ncbi:MAG TPA: hypothetical protein VG095_03380, partial [Chthoniobacterales bacterium]|nr:hypothetical protein [Chthoniobacterales bacterium]
MPNGVLRRTVLLLCAFASAAAGQPAQNPSAIDALIPWLLDENNALQGIPFTEVIKATTGKQILPFRANDKTDQRVAKQLGAALDEVVRKMSAPDSAVQSFARINEVSGPFEQLLRDLLEAAPELSCDFPKTAEEKTQRSGYPDLRLVDDAGGRVYYLDPKLYAAGSRDSSFRTFYFEPKLATNKVREDAVHLLIGFEHEERQAGHWRFTRWDIVD